MKSLALASLASLASSMLVFTPLPSAAQGNATVQVNGQTVLSAGSNRANASITIDTDSEKAPAEVNRIRSLAISVNGKELFVPRSVYADLEDPREASLGVRRKGFMLTILGGDASNSYSVCVDFDARKVSRRVVSSALTPGRISEETRYRLNVLRDE